jgi:hypothetical protein
VKVRQLALKETHSSAANFHFLGISNSTAVAALIYIILKSLSCVNMKRKGGVPFNIEAIKRKLRRILLPPARAEAMTKWARRRVRAKGTLGRNSPLAPSGWTFFKANAPRPRSTKTTAN